MSIFGEFKALGELGPEEQVYSHEPDKQTDLVMEEPAQERAIEPFIAFGIILFILLIGRLLMLQVSQGQYNLGLAEGNRIRVKTTPAPRGIIFDRFNNPLLTNVVRYDLSLIPADLPKKKSSREVVYKSIKEKIDIPLDDIVNNIEKSGLYSIEPIVLKQNLSQETALEYEIKIQDISALSITKEPVRSYLTDKGLGHVLGYIGKVSSQDLKDKPDYHLTDWIGKTGLEKNYEADLKGKDGQEQVEVDANGRLQRVIASSPPTQGNNLYLSLDLKVQEVTYQALQKSIQNNNAAKGAVISFNPKTGAIYSYVSYPDYDPNQFVSNDRKALSSLFTNSDLPLLDRIIGGTYPAGSSIKPIYAAAALQEGVVTPSFAIDTPSEIRIGSSVFPDWKDHGLTDIKTAIAQSNNIFFYALGGGWDKIKGLGITRLDEYLKKFGFDSLTHIDLPGEKTGFVPTPEWKKQKKRGPWYIGDTYHLSIGQGDLSVTPIEMMSALSSIFNDGHLVVPHFAQTVKNIEGNEVKTINPESSKDSIISASNLNVVKQGMRQTVESGSAQSLKDITGLNGQMLQIGGKTGTAQSGQGDKTHAWFAGFAPWNDPKIGVLVLIEDGGEGSTSAAPVAGSILQSFFRDDNPDSK